MEKRLKVDGQTKIRLKVDRLTAEGKKMDIFQSSFSLD